MQISAKIVSQHVVTYTQSSQVGKNPQTCASS